MNPVPTIRHGIPPGESPLIAVAIVGAGACGLVAALALRNAGVECVVLERDAQPRGSTALSSGFIPAPGSATQRAAGVNDSVALFMDDIQAKAHGGAAPRLVAAYAHAIGPAIDMLAKRHGIEFELLDGFLYPGHSVRRMHAVPERTGAALMLQLERSARAAGADLLAQAMVHELWVDEAQQITGIGYQRPDGRTEHLRCHALLLACNGFGGNAQLVGELLPGMYHAPFAGHSGNDGSAIAWGRQLGARLADLGAYQGHGSWAIPHGILVSWALMMEGAIQVNDRGERFHDETQGYSEAAVHVLAQPGGVAWNVFDAPILALAEGFPDFCAAQAAGAVKRCADVQALATLIGCDAARVGAACSQTTRALAAPAADEVPKPGGAKRALQAPFFAVKVTGALFHTQGGLDIDAQCRVLRADGTAFPNLLAAGGAARGVSGHAVWGYLSGNGLLSAVAGGAIAAGTIIHRGMP